MALRQGKQTAAEFALTFHMLAAQTVWVDDTLKLLFQSELPCRDEGRNLDEFIELTIRIDTLIHSRRPNTNTSALLPVVKTTSDHEPMQVGFTHLSSEERE